MRRLFRSKVICLLVHQLSWIPFKPRKLWKSAMRPVRSYPDRWFPHTVIDAFKAYIYLSMEIVHVLNFFLRKTYIYLLIFKLSFPIAVEPIPKTLQALRAWNQYRKRYKFVLPAIHRPLTHRALALAGSRASLLADDWTTWDQAEGSVNSWRGRGWGFVFLDVESNWIKIINGRSHRSATVAFSIIGIATHWLCCTGSMVCAAGWLHLL